MSYLIHHIVIIGWGIFGIYWFLSAIESKKNKSSKTKRFIGIRILVVLIFFLLLRSHSLNTSSFNNQNLVSIDKILIGLGYIIFVLGLSLAVWARIHLGKNWGMPMSQNQDPEIVVTGPYRYIRHPIYTGILLALIGSVLASGLAWIVILIFAVPYFIYSSLNEEKLMMKQFPKAYPAYKLKTKMFIPLIV